MDISKYKYLRKNEFRIHTNPKYKNKEKKNHVAYVSLKHGDMYRVNAITHSKQFKNRRTMPLTSNPHKDGISSSQKSRLSIPFWEHERYLKNKPKDVWRFDKKERRAINKFNKKYFKKQKKNPTRK